LPFASDHGERNFDFEPLLSIGSANVLFSGWSEGIHSETKDRPPRRNRIADSRDITREAINVST
jgi:hypothetical protein